MVLGFKYYKGEETEHNCLDETLNSLFSGAPDKIELDVVESQTKLSITCSVSGCVPPPVITLSTSGYVIPETSVYTSSNTTTVTGSVILSDSAAIQCMVAVLGTNYTATVQERYNKSPDYRKTVAKPYTSASHVRYQSVIIFIFFVILLML